MSWASFVATYKVLDMILLPLFSRFPFSGFWGIKNLIFAMSTVGDPVEVGKPVQARVLDVVKTDGIVDLTLRSELLQVSKEETTKSKKEKNKKVWPLPCSELVADWPSHLYVESLFFIFESCTCDSMICHLRKFEI
jgi:hypothetical protein